MPLSPSGSGGVAGRVGYPRRLESGTSQFAGVAVSASSTVGSRVVAAVRQTEVDTQRLPQPDDLDLAQLHQRGMNAEGSLALDAGLCRQVRQPLEGRHELGTTIGIAAKINYIDTHVDVEALQDLGPAQRQRQKDRVAGRDVGDRNAGGHLFF